MKMVLKDGKMKVFTMSYDDGVIQDKRLMEIMDRNGLKGTFNMSSGTYLAEELERGENYYKRMKRSESIELYTDSGHEVAIHGYTHPWLDLLDSTEVIKEIVEDRKDVEATYGTIARGMAYPFGAYNDEVVKILEMCGVAYARTTKAKANESYAQHWFSFPKNWLTLDPTCHHNHPRLMEIAEQFVQENRYRTPWMFYLWGHSYEFDNDNNWELIEKFAEFIGGRDDVWYATNIEIYDYVKAYESLQTNYEKTRVYNPSCQTVWFREKNQNYCVKPGETVEL